jgi:hypothetical protein
VRPAPAAAAAVRVRGGAGAALRRTALPLGPSRAALDAAALPVVGRRPSPAHAWLARAGRPARGEGWAGAARRGRTVGAQGRAQQRARGAAGGGRLAEPQETVSAAAAALTRPRRCADTWSGGS